MRKMLLAVFVLLATAMAADTDLVGGYQGQWKSNESGNGGEFHFVLGNEGGTWSCEPGFILDGSEVKGTTKRLKLEDGKIELVYEFQAQGYGLRTSHRGEWAGGEFKGTYQTVMIEDSRPVDSGTWTAKRKK